MAPTQTRVRIFLLIAVGMLLLTGCDRSTLHTNKRALHLAKLEREGKIQQAKDKVQFLELVGEQITENMASIGYAHRINEMRSTWNLYVDKNYDILTGSVAKTDTDIYVFVVVYDRARPVFEAFGESSQGKYPEGIIPDSLL